MTRVYVLLLASAAAIFSQPVRPEVFGYVGRVRAAADEGSLGSGLLRGGDVIVPIGHRLGIGIDAGTAKTGVSFGLGDFQLRRTFVGFSLLGRWGLFAGAGGGFEHSNSASTIGSHRSTALQRDREVPPFAAAYPRPASGSARTQQPKNGSSSPSTAVLGSSNHSQ